MIVSLILKIADYFDNINLSQINFYYDRKFKKGDEVVIIFVFLEDLMEKIFDLSLTLQNQL